MNRNASIISREGRGGKFRTETSRRDNNTVSVALTTNPRTDATMLFVDAPDGDTFTFDGRTARTLYRVLQKHYKTLGRAW